MRRIAYCSPVNPQPSGISDYSEDLLPFLGQYADVTLFVDGVVPAHPSLRQHLDVRSIERLPQLHAAQPFDALVYHLGNSPVHAAIYDMAQRLPGVVVLHEWVLHHFKLWHAATRRGDVGRYLAEMAWRYGDRGEAVARRMAQGQLLDAAFAMPLVEDVIERAQGVIVHSDYVLGLAQTLRPTLPVARVPMGVPLLPHVEMAHARATLGLPTDVPIWASFGHINPYKRIEGALRAFRRYKLLEPDALYVLVGSVSGSYDLAAVTRRLDLGSSVIVTGYVSPADFAAYVSASDLCLNLRYPTAGETSASLLRLLSAGRPTLVSAVDAMQELPDAVCAKVDPGKAEQEQILAYARLFQRYPQVARQLGVKARAFVAAEHSLERAARGYIDFLGSVNGWGPTTIRRPALWSTESAQPSSPAPARTAQATSREDGPLSAIDVPMAITGMVAATGQVAAELGIKADDEAVLPALAHTIRDLVS
ncbi:MAG: Mannosyltransferase A [uncultured Chloroflexia bacterium]|uniref:Mannosyltransferase A n=1 Tax=uncultured Chloroflexia bacterium TaxID=1672391 RepID=A0A6J4LCA8_9CHLR|nr:MAG: Mannosyltransferase A [uncultured Chloroflexia bacterium]